MGASFEEVERQRLAGLGVRAWCLPVDLVVAVVEVQQAGGAGAVFLDLVRRRAEDAGGARDSECVAREVRDRLVVGVQQPPFQWDRQPSLRLVDDAIVVDRGAEADELVGDGVARIRLTAVACHVARGAAQGFDSDGASVKRQKLAASPEPGTGSSALGSTVAVPFRKSVFGLI